MDKTVKKVATELSSKNITHWKDVHAHYKSLCMAHDEGWLIFSTILLTIYELLPCLEMLEMIDLVEKTRLQWESAVVNGNRMKALMESLERENKWVKF
jgi:hypothetical protein